MEAMLDLPTGRLIVGDPGELFGDSKPLGLEFAPGSYPVTADPSGFELRLAEAEPVRWFEAAPAFDTPSGHVCLLDAAALDEFTDLGDEPVDEYELLAERFADHPDRPVQFSGLVVFPAGRAAGPVRAGRDRDGRCTRITVAF
ncbi:MAG: hypothetical protein ACRDVE_11595 [Actinocrinis sp.]